MEKCKYEMDIREYCDYGVLGNVSIKGFDFNDVYGDFGDEYLAKLIKNLPVLEYFILLEEPCDCWIKYGSVMHNDGGNYHSRIRIFEITPCVYLAIYGDTREAFSMDEFKYIVIWVEDQPVGVVVAKTDCCRLLKKEELEDFIESYVQEGYNIYYCD
jgi:hypothetical protein